MTTQTTTVLDKIVTKSGGAVRAGHQERLFWTWDTDTTTSLASQSLFYSLANSRGAINGQLAPVARPNACS
jgi:hypothetical protein